MKRLLLTVAGVGLTTTLVMAQTQAVRGKVVDASTGEAIIGANIIVKGHTNVGAATNLDGAFTLNAPRGAKTLVVSYIGYKTLEVPISSNMTVKLAADAAQLDDVVIVGYGSARKAASVVSSVVTVKAKDLESKPSPSPLEALQGKVSGLQMFTSSGEPSEIQSLRLRGTGSLGAESTPLYVLDGAPVDPSTIRGINANDIESVQVLKDASATSIYGARAANGVIYITTKRGRVGESAQVTIRGQYGVSNLANRDYFDSFMSTDQLLAYHVATGIRTQAAADQIKKDYPNNTDWSSYIYRDNRPSYQTDISVSGGAGRTQYYLSAARQYQEGLRHGSEYGKSAFRINLNTAINKYITVGTNNMLSLDRFRTSPYPRNAIMAGLVPLMQPWFSPYDKDGNEVDLIPGANRYTPSYETSKNVSLQGYTTLNSSSFIQIKPIDALVIRSQFSYEHKSYDYDQVRYPSHKQNLNNGYAYKENALTKGMTWTNTIEYKFDFDKKHNFVLLGGHEYVDNDYNIYSLSGQGLTNDLLVTVDQLTKEKNYTANVQQYAFLSFFGRLSYDFDGKYFADFTYRNDASSRLAAGNRNAGFWSLGLMWRAKKESFLRPVSWLDDLTIKYSVGTQGNAAIGNYSAYALAGKNGQANAITGRGIISAGNPNLGWERQFSTSIGIEAALFSRLRVNLELYHRLTSDMLMDVPFPYHTGFIDANGYNNISQNVGKYQNRGIDLSVNYDILKDKKGNGLSAYVNLNYNTDKVVELFQGRPSWVIPNTAVAYVVGSPVMYFYPLWAGVNPDNGDAQWYVPGEDTAVTNKSTKTSQFSEALEQNTGIKRYAPWNGGFGLRGSYAGFNLDADFSFSLGKNLIANDAFFFENPTAFVGWNQRTTVEDYWKKPGDNTRFPRYGVRFTEFDSRMIKNASFARLKTLTLGYSVPQSLLKKQKIVKGAKVYVTGRNLLTFTSFDGVDPEVDSNLTLGVNPNTKQVVFGVELNF